MHSHTLCERPRESNTGQGNVRRALCKSCKVSDVYALPRVSVSSCTTRATSLWTFGLQCPVLRLNMELQAPLNPESDICMYNCIA